MINISSHTNPATRNLMASSMSLATIMFAVAVAMAAMATTTTVSAQNTPQDFVNLHNRARAADHVGPVAWDNRVARFAQDYAARRAGDCRLEHSGGPFGENIFKGSGTSWTAADAVGMWVAEKRSYHLESNSCDAGAVCGHYTQVVWRKSTRIGCARAVCAANRGVFIVCSYDPPGNFNGERPFLTLDTAAK